MNLTCDFSDIQSIRFIDNFLCPTIEIVYQNGYIQKEKRWIDTYSTLYDEYKELSQQFKRWKKRKERKKIN
jgi:hypothetical protein